jgi:PiT family inorganic phosphate transporter
VVGAVVGIGLLRGGRGINWKVLANIASGWVTTPVIACIVCFVALFFVQNVFNQQVYREVAYVLSEPVLARLQAQEVAVEPLRAHLDERFDTVREFRRMLRNREDLDRKVQSDILNAARIDVMVIDPAHFARLADSSLSAAQASALRALAGRRFDHRWMLDDALGAIEAQWRSLPATKKNKLVNRRLQRQRQEVYALFEPDQL